MRCPRCGGRIWREDVATLVCLDCGERLHHRRLLFAERVADAASEQAERDDAHVLYAQLRGQYPELRARPRWDARALMA